MTHGRLIHLAELAEEAAEHSDNPPWARHLADAARDARWMAAVEARNELDTQLHVMLDDIKAAMAR